MIKKRQSGDPRVLRGGVVAFWEEATIRGFPSPLFDEFGLSPIFIR